MSIGPLGTNFIKEFKYVVYKAVAMLFGPQCACHLHVIIHPPRDMILMASPPTSHWLMGHHLISHQFIVAMQGTPIKCLLRCLTFEFRFFLWLLDPVPAECGVFVKLGKWYMGITRWSVLREEWMMTWKMTWMNKYESSLQRNTG